jgi:SAM-dependent methyltransferase
VESLLKQIFTIPISVNENLIQLQSSEATGNQVQTNDTFSEKWKEVEQMENTDKLYKMQFNWFLSLYGFSDESDLAKYLSTKKFIIDTGCGLGYKAAWFAKLAPSATVIGIDYSDAVYLAAKNYKKFANLFFFKGDIADTKLKEGSIDFVVCDQVIMHTENPERTFQHLSTVTTKGGEFACYVYSKKALPRELIDDYFRTQTHQIPKDQMWEFSAQLTELGKRLSELNVKFVSPDIPLLGIKGGEYDIQRFIYWNFLKCFWNAEWGFGLSKSTNFDWYAPSNAKRFTKEEFEKLVSDNQLTTTYFHQEEACYSGRFRK